ncbi:hypothetical protein [Streptomyces sindenensis]|uniref:Tetratricopeptide repeat protein n=1 Tax=Streptomyces sindenensis TaxID=67363 RepID=A0ABW6ETY7_9ACTN
MTIKNPDDVPATPVYTITVSADGIASINGEQVTEEGLDPNAARVAALSEIVVKAALHGRPVRVLAKESDGSAWPLIVDVNGTVTELDHPHPTPAPTAVPKPPEQLPTPRNAPAGGTTDHGRPTARPAAEWGEPLPEAHRPSWTALVAQAEAGDAVEAIITADRLETELGEQYGPDHPHTLNVLSVRAWLTLRHTTEWAETTELLIETGERLLLGGSPYVGDTARTIRNAHAAWSALRTEDPETALELADRVLALLDALATLTSDTNARDTRARHVLDWVQSGAARRGAA